MSLYPSPAQRAIFDAYQRGVAATMRGDLRTSLVHLHAALEHLMPGDDLATFVAIAVELADAYTILAAQDDTLITQALHWSQMALHPELHSS